ARHRVVGLRSGDRRACARLSQLHVLQHREGRALGPPRSARRLPAHRARVPRRTGVSSPRAAARAPQRALVESLRSGLARRADARKARAMQAYMKSAMPYRGVSTPALRAACREVFDAARLGTFPAWRDAARPLSRP